MSTCPWRCGPKLTVIGLLFILQAFASDMASAAVRVEAYRGEPFGLGRIRLAVPGADVAARDDRISVVEANSRVLYPVIASRSVPVRQLLRSFLDIETPSRATLYFMFRGDEPLELTVYTPEPEHIVVRPAADPEEFHELLDDWWNATVDRYEEVFRRAAYPVVVDNFLVATWARRLHRDMPQPSRELFARFRMGQPWLSSLMASEAYQTAVEQEILLGDAWNNEEASLPLSAIGEDTAQRGRDDVGEANVPTEPHSPLGDQVEPIAGHVPEECFYLRFGNFPNYLWFRDFLRHWQGDLGNMLVMQSIDRDNSERFQQQIAIGESKLSRVMGPAVIQDVAIIGLDPYMRDGPAMGLLFHARNNALLSRNLNGQRTTALERHAGATEETIEIGGKSASFVSAPDSGLRSFYAIDGDFHLVTNCRRLVERFYEAGSGVGALGGNQQFQEARAEHGLDREDTIFAFVSSAFFDHLAGPHYRIELYRRMKSIGEMRAIKLARLAAGAEGNEAESITELMNVELLPEGFGKRSDGSRLVRRAVDEAESEQADGAEGRDVVVLDSRRGAPGWMVPIPDVAVERITPSEARHYRDFRRELDEQVRGFSPLYVAIKRIPASGAEDLDRVLVDARVASFSQMPLAEWPRMLGPSASVRVAPIPGDIVSLELVLEGLSEPLHVFGGLKDFRTPLVVREGQVEAAASISEFARGYLGAWPRPGLLDRFLGRPEGPLDEEGTGRTGGLFDLWFRRAGDFFLFSFHRDILIEVGQNLGMLEAERPAQIRLQIDDLHDKQVADAVTALGYSRARDASASAARFMNSLATQLHVPVEEARQVAENLVVGTFACPLGGQYVLVDPLNPAHDGAGAGDREELPAPDDESRDLQPSTRRALWASTAPTPANRFLLTQLPADYVMPFMTWFRGMSAEVSRIEDDLSLHVELEMVHIDPAPPVEEQDMPSGGIQLPSLGDFFGRFSEQPSADGEKEETPGQREASSSADAKPEE